MSTVFISYRRETVAGEARALFNDLVARLGKNSVFMDVDSIALGRDFRTVLLKILGSCDLMLVIIDKDWAGVKDEGGRTRLGDPGDYVRLEVEAALKRDIVVTPVLVKGAHMPAADQLPAEIRDLVYRNGFELSHNRWESDVGEMIRRLGLDLPGGGRQIETDHWPISPREATGRSIPIGQPKGKQRYVWVLVSALIIVTSSVGMLLLYRYGSELVRSLGRPHELAEYKPGGTDPLNATPPTAIGCNEEKNLHSLPISAATQTTISFTNEGSNIKRIYWLNQTGERELYATLTTGKSISIQTYVTHPWVVANSSDQCEAIYMPTPFRQDISIAK